MKSIYTICCLCLATLLSQSQNASRFPINPLAVWKVYHYKIYIDQHNKADEIYEYYIENDTLINSLNYYKLYKSGVAYYDTPFFYNRIYVGAIRDAENKFFYLKKGDISEVMLFDFNLKLGDTIRSIIGKGRVVDFIETLPDGRKRFECRHIFCAGCCPVIQIIEGIGHAGGIMENPPCTHIGFSGNCLTCYLENGKLIYQNNLGIIENECKQNLSRFPINPSAVWKIQTGPGDIGDNKQHRKGDEIYEYYIKNDTILNSLKYYKLYKSGVAYYDTPFYFNSVYVGAIRDDNNKFFYFKKADTSEVMLFDFNLKLGDTIQAFIGKGHVINHMDTLPGGRKKIECINSIFGGCMAVVQIIEGIGHAGGIMEDLPCIHIGLSGHYLTCYLENGKLIYHNDLGFFDSECEPNSSIRCVCNKNARMNIYPMPFNEMVTIEFSDSYSDITLLEIYNVQGIKMSIKKVYTTMDSNRIKLDVSGLQKGIYIIKIGNENSFHTQKLMKE